VALLDGAVTEAQFEEHRFTDPVLLDLVARIKIHRDEEINKRYPNGIPNRLTITLKNGRKFVREVEFPRGHAHNPMLDSEVEQKFRTMAEPRYGEARASQILSVCWNLDQLSDLGELTRLVND
jgi:2-methylcitrate dehydratase